MNNSQNSGTGSSSSGSTRSNQETPKGGPGTNAGGANASSARSSGAVGSSTGPSASSPSTSSTGNAGAMSAKPVTAGDAVAMVTKTMQDAGEQTRQAAVSLAAEAGEQAKHLIDEQVGIGAEVADELARSIRLAADNLATTAPLVAGFARLAADRVETFADTVRDQTAEELLATASDYVRGRPMIVFGAAATCGFVLFRLLKAMPQRPITTARSRSGEAWPLQPRGDEWVEKRPGMATRSYGSSEKGQFHGT
jgi:ElaB/YqjD/DUF883 family membrane-anchored ribosome-binding protein